MSPMSRFIKDLESKIVTIKVGEGEQSRQYQLPSAILRSASPWFENALKDDRFQEGRSSTIALPEDTPDAFNSFVHYAYNGNLIFESEPKDLEARTDELILLYRTWVFGDKYLTPPLQNCAMHRICLLMDDKWCGNILSSDALATCWHISNEGTPLRLLIADYIVNRSKTDKAFGMPECPGLLHALRSSWQKSYDLKDSPNDFPRFRKPKKFSSDLHINERDDNSEDLLTYDNTWDELSLVCEDCGHVTNTLQFCRKCKDVGCKCVWEKGMAQLCYDCVWG